MTNRAVQVYLNMLSEADIGCQNTSSANYSSFPNFDPMGTLDAGINYRGKFKACFSGLSHKLFTKLRVSYSCRHSSAWILLSGIFKAHYPDPVHKRAVFGRLIINETAQLVMHSLLRA